MTAESELAQMIYPPPILKQFRAGEIELNYATCGTGPDLVLLHGGTSGWGMWYALIPELAKHFTVFALDLPWSGGSTKPSALDHERYVIDPVSQFVTTICRRAPIIVGHSFGGWVALKLVLRGIEIKRLVLIDSMGFSRHAPLLFRFSTLRPFTRLLTKTALRPTREIMDNFLTSVFYDRSLQIPDLVLNYFFEALSCGRFFHPLEFIATLYSGGRLKEKFDLREQCQRIDLPVGIIWGKHDSVAVLHYEQAGFALLPRYTLRLCENSGHVPPLEEPEKCLQYILELTS